MPKSLHVRTWALCWALACAPGAVPADDDYSAQRGRMVTQQIESRGISDAATLAAMRKVPRHEFVS